MPRMARLTLAGFGRTNSVTVSAVRPEREQALLAAVRDGAPDGLLAYGGGRSYGDCALVKEGTAVLTGRLDRLLAFDPASGEVVCEAGVTMGELVRVLGPRGFLPPACPGSARVTIGGAIANDVHGKDQATAGSFGHHVRWIDLVLPSGEVVRVSRDARPELFEATIGGIGLTGVVLRASVTLAAAASTAIAWRARRIAHLDELLIALDQAARTSPYVVAWIDGTARGDALGRGILETAEPAPEGTETWLPSSRFTEIGAIPSLPFMPATIAGWNAWRLRRVPDGGLSRTLAAGRFFFPLESGHVYSHLRMHELHAVFPEADAGKGLRRVLEAIGASAVAPLLVIVKRFGRAGLGHLSFAIPGHSLVIDLPAGAGARELLDRVEGTVAQHGGRVYLAKDSTLSAQRFARMYPRLPAFRRVLLEIDPRGVFRSELAARLRVREASA
jgi:decaprenylphospho-beta-D-ribofuranose 2-oxidase